MEKTLNNEKLVAELVDLRLKVAELKALDQLISKQTDQIREWGAKLSTAVVVYRGETIIYTNAAADALIRKYQYETIENLIRNSGKNDIHIRETTLRTSNQQSIPIEIIESPIIFEDHQATLMIIKKVLKVSQENIAIQSLLKKIEQAKQEWESTVDSLSDLICLVDKDGRIIRVNRTLEKWRLGEVVTAKGKILHHLLETQETASAQAFRQFWLDAWCKIMQEQTAKWEYYNETLGRYFSLYVRALNTPPQTAVVVIKDITEQKRTEEALASERELLDVTLYAIADGVITTDIEGRVALYNKATEAITGWSEKDVLGQPLPTLFHELDEKTGEICPINLVKMVLKDDQTIHLDEQAILVSRENKRREIAGSATPVRNTKGETIGVVIVFQDITETRRLERSKSSFLNAISHELRTPLTAILGYVELILSTKISGSAKEYAIQIQKSADRQAKLVEELLTIVKLESGTEEYQFQEINAYYVFNWIANHINQYIAQIIKERPTVTQFKYTHTVAESLKNHIIQVDHTRLQQVIENIINNSVKYSPQDRIAVNLMVNVDNNHIVTKITDQGYGIPESEHQNIFKPFYQIRKGKFDVSDGIGCGLAVVKRYIDKHNGVVSINSEIDRGSCFTFTLPIYQKMEL